MNLIVNLISSVVLVAMLSIPTITPSANGELFKVQFEAGAVGACTTFTQTTGPDLPFSSYSCWFFGDNSKTTTYIDNWDLIPKLDENWEVHATIEYPDGHEVTTNSVEVHR